MIDQEEIHNQCLSNDPIERLKALVQLKDYFSSLSNGEQAWKDLIKLAYDENREVRLNAASSLGYLFLQVIDKQRAWNDLIKLTNNEERFVRYEASRIIGSSFSDMSNKQQAWNDVHKLTTNKDSKLRVSAALILYSSFSCVPNKQKAWDDLHNLANDKDSDVRYEAARTLGFVFSDVPDKQAAWKDLLKLTNDEDSDVRYEATRSLGSAFFHVPDKQQVWSYLYRLVNDEDEQLSWWAARSLGSAYSQVPDKLQAWYDLHKLANDIDSSIRSGATFAIGSAFSDVPDKQMAWKDLHKLTNDEESYVRYEATRALGLVFSHIPDKQMAWEDLRRLTSDVNGNVRYEAARSLGFVFSYLPDKQQAWSYLHRLTDDEELDLVRYGAAYALGFAYSCVLDPKLAWDDLIRLVTDQDNDVRTYANHSLGKVSIFKASKAESEEDYRIELEKAIEYFEKAARESSEEGFNPSQFCLPFYRLFYTIVFKKQEAKEEVNKYLAETKSVIENSKSKELLLKAVENLANALNEVQNLNNMNLKAMKGELNSYRKYCDHAEELMKNTEEKAPIATMAVRKGLPILGRNLKLIIEEIQDKAKTACKESRGTLTQEIACTISREVQNWGIGNQEEMTSNVSKVVMVLKSKIPHTLENKEILDMIESMKYEKDLTRQYGILPIIIGLIPTVNVVPVEPILDEIKELGASVDQLIISIDKLPNPQGYLDIIQRDLKEIKDYMPGMKEKIEEILYELYTPLSTTQKLKIAIPIIPSIVSYEQETDVPEFVAENIHELKNFFYKMRDSLKKLH